LEILVVEVILQVDLDKEAADEDFETDSGVFKGGGVLHGFGIHHSLQILCDTSF
tara:strand:- start:908 stop:1069 length:162 start_codon:yes stop_codon:yes gene_type:complete